MSLPFVSRFVSKQSRKRTPIFLAMACWSALATAQASPPPSTTDEDSRLRAEATAVIRRLMDSVKENSVSLKEIQAACAGALPESRYGDLLDEVLNQCERSISRHQQELGRLKADAYQQLDGLVRRVWEGRLASREFATECLKLADPLSREMPETAKKLNAGCLLRLADAEDGLAAQRDSAFTAARAALANLLNGSTAIPAGATVESLCTSVTASLAANHPRRPNFLRQCQERVGALLAGGSALRQAQGQVDTNIQQVLSRRLPPAGAAPECERATLPLRPYPAPHQESFERCRQAVLAQNNPAPAPTPSQESEGRLVMIHNICPTPIRVALRDLKSGQLLPLSRKQGTAYTIGAAHSRGFFVRNGVDFEVLTSVASVPNARLVAASITPVPCVPIDYIDEDEAREAKKAQESKLSYGRGIGYTLFDRDKQRCFAQHSQGCEIDGLLWYPKCKSGYTGVGPVCWKK